MVTIGMNYDVLEGKEQVFEKAFERVREAMSQPEGHADSRLYRQVGADSPEYLIVSRWSSSASCCPTLSTAWLSAASCR